MLEDAGVNSGCSPSMRQDAYNSKGKNECSLWLGWMVGLPETSVLDEL